LAEFIAIFVAMLWNFFINLKWTWRPKNMDVSQNDVPGAS
jgi:putative flippase GtrA